jgi:REP element-mobilizing transposase RayT
MSRGNGGEAIFQTDGDHRKFIEYIAKAAEKFGIIVHVYCLMPNHYHMVIETPESNLSVSIQWLNVSYACYFNARHQRHGHLFQGRFKSILIDKSEYLDVLSRYIHLNPVRANLVSKMSDYEWNSYRFFIGQVGPPVWLDVNRLLAGFGTKKNVAMARYRSYVEDVDLATLKNPTDEVLEGCILGSPVFAEWVRKSFLSDRVDESQVPQLKKLKTRPTVDLIVDKVAGSFRVKKSQILAKGQKGNMPRDVAIYFAKSLTGVSGQELGMKFGNISGAAITVRSGKINERMEANSKFRRKMRTIRERIVNN